MRVYTVFMFIYKDRDANTCIKRSVFLNKKEKDNI